MLWSVLCGGSGMAYLKPVVYLGSVVYFRSVVYLRSVVCEINGEGGQCMRSLVCKVCKVKEVSILNVS